MLLQFDGYIQAQKWDLVLKAQSSSEKVVANQNIITKGIEASFKKKTMKKKSSEPSWVSEEIRKNICRW